MVAVHSPSGTVPVLALQCKPLVPCRSAVERLERKSKSIALESLDLLRLVLGVHSRDAALDETLKWSDMPIGIQNVFAAVCAANVKILIIKEQWGVSSR